MINETEFRLALMDLEGEVRRGATFEEAIETIALESGLPAAGILKRAEKAFGDLAFTERQLHQAAKNEAADDEARELGRALADMAVQETARDDVIKVPFVVLHVMVHAHFKDQRKRKLAYDAGKARLSELGRGNLFA